MYGIYYTRAECNQPSWYGIRRGVASAKQHDIFNAAILSTRWSSSLREWLCRINARLLQCSKWCQSTLGHADTVLKCTGLSFDPFCCSCL